MINQVIPISRNEIDAMAYHYFITSCGFGGDLQKYKNMLAEGLAVRDMLIDDIELRAIVSFFDKSVLKEKEIVVSGLSFSCGALAQIDKGSVLGVYGYIITAGDSMISSDSALRQFYADAWGNAYLEGSEKWLQNRILAHAGKGAEEVFLSDTFGPGFYGMDISEMTKLFTILRGEKIGVTLNESCVMQPQKSRGGFYMATADKRSLHLNACQNCIGNKDGCQFCSVAALNLYYFSN